MKSIAHLEVEDHQRVTAAVSEVEQQTNGEIVTILAEQSDGYGDVALAWAAFAALLKLLSFALLPGLPTIVLATLMGGWNTELTPQMLLVFASVATSGAFAIVWLLQLWTPLKFAVIPGIIKTDRVHDCAVRAFRIGAERRTQGRTGILIYLSMREHRAEIVADEAIATKVDPEVWGEAMETMLAELKQGRVTDGLVAAIKEVGTVLAEHFPKSDDNNNELPDRLIEV